MNAALSTALPWIGGAVVAGGIAGSALWGFNETRTNRAAEADRFARDTERAAAAPDVERRANEWFEQLEAATGHDIRTSPARGFAARDVAEWVEAHPAPKGVDLQVTGARDERTGVDDRVITGAVVPDAGVTPLRAGYMFEGGAAARTGVNLLGGLGLASVAVAVGGFLVGHPWKGLLGGAAVMGAALLGGGVVSAGTFIGRGIARATDDSRAGS